MKKINWLFIFGCTVYITHEVPLNASIKNFNMEQAGKHSTFLDINNIESPGWLSEISVGIKKTMKIIADSVRDIQPFKLQKNSIFLPIGPLKTDLYEQMKRQRKQISELREQVIQERNIVQQFQSSISEEELLRLISLGRLLEEETDSSIFEPEEVENPAIPKGPYLTQNWQVPEMLQAPNSVSSNGDSSSQSSQVSENKDLTSIDEQEHAEKEGACQTCFTQHHNYQENKKETALNCTEFNSPDYFETHATFHEYIPEPPDYFETHATFHEYIPEPPDYFETHATFHDSFSELTNCSEAHFTDSKPCSSFLPDLLLSLPLLPGTVLKQHSPYSITRKEIIPRGLGVNDRIVIINYDIVQPAQNQLKRRVQNPDLKLGGVLMELQPINIASIIKFLTGIDVNFIDMFLKNQGRCAIGLNNREAEAEQIIQSLNRRLWLGPQHALYAQSELASNVLSKHVKIVRRSVPLTQKFPRHLVTVEYWTKRNLASADLIKNKKPECKPSKDTVKTTAMTVNPLERAPIWYQGSRKSEHVENLEWELGRKFSKEMDPIECKIYEMSRSNDGWRLPTISELEILYQQKEVLGDDYSRDWFWSSTPVIDYGAEYWGLDFEKGFVYYNDDYHDLKVRLVRSPQKKS